MPITAITQWTYVAGGIVVGYALHAFRVRVAPYLARLRTKWLP